MKTTVGVFFGGRSVEHEISVLTALQAMYAFDSNKYNIVPVYISKEGRWYSGEALMSVSNFRDMNALKAQCEEVYMNPEFGDYNLYRRKKKLFGNPIVTTLDVVIPALHGTNGEDGVFQGLLETIGIPFAGCNTLSAAIGMDKIVMKMVLESCNIPIVDYVWFTDKQWFADRDRWADEVEQKIGYPVIVKPANLGSSVGISRADNRAEFMTKVDEASRYSTRLVVEDLVENLKEINCSVLGDCDDYMASVCEEPIKSGKILSYEDKYMGGSQGESGMQASEKRIPADLTPEQTARVQFLAGETFRVLSCHGVARVDVMIDDNTGDIYVNEINAIPGSLSFYLWEATKLPFDELMDRMVQLALKRKREAANKTVSYTQNIFALGGGGVKGAKGAKGAKLK
ncbi:MAG: D-alanine--D-alanine ligase [Bacteroidaceae bacterium]|nr:D-alanine--D-alanine ligase [Bacteroidaceae bacterium]